MESMLARSRELAEANQWQIAVNEIKQFIGRSPDPACVPFSVGPPSSVLQQFSLENNLAVCEFHLMMVGDGEPTQFLEDFESKFQSLDARIRGLSSPGNKTVSYENYAEISIADLEYSIRFNKMKLQAMRHSGDDLGLIFSRKDFDLLDQETESNNLIQSHLDSSQGRRGEFTLAALCVLQVAVRVRIAQASCDRVELMGLCRLLDMHPLLQLAKHQGSSAGKSTIYKPGEQKANIAEKGNNIFSCHSKSFLLVDGPHSIDDLRQTICSLKTQCLVALHLWEQVIKVCTVCKDEKSTNFSLNSRSVRNSMHLQLFTGLAHMMLGNFEHACTILTEAATYCLITDTAEFVLLINMLGCCHARQGHFNAASKIFRRALDQITTATRNIRFQNKESMILLTLLNLCLVHTQSQNDQLELEFLMVLLDRLENFKGGDCKEPVHQLSHSIKPIFMGDLYVLSLIDDSIQPCLLLAILEQRNCLDHKVCRRAYEHAAKLLSRGVKYTKQNSVTTSITYLAQYGARLSLQCGNLADAELLSALALSDLASSMTSKDDAGVSERVDRVTRAHDDSFLEAALLVLAITRSQYTQNPVALDQHCPVSKAWRLGPSYGIRYDIAEVKLCST